MFSKIGPLSMKSLTTSENFCKIKNLNNFLFGMFSQSTTKHKLPLTLKDSDDFIMKLIYSFNSKHIFKNTFRFEFLRRFFFAKHKNLSFIRSF